MRRVEGHRGKKTTRSVRLDMLAKSVFMLLHFDAVIYVSNRSVPKRINRGRQYLLSGVVKTVAQKRVRRHAILDFFYHKLLIRLCTLASPLKKNTGQVRESKKPKMALLL